MYAMDMSWADGRMRKRVCERACGRVTDRTTELAGGKAGGRANGRDSTHQGRAISSRKEIGNVDYDSTETNQPRLAS